MSSSLPRPVVEGSKLAIVAPAGPFDETAFRKGVEWLRKRYVVEHSDDIYSRHGYFAGDDQRRRDELISAINDPDVDAILCARGGYGATRLLPDLDLDQIKQANKLVVGFSDITALHALWASAGIRSVHAPMVAALGGASVPVREKWIEAIENPGRTQRWSLLAAFGSESEANGTLLGGNLAVLVALNGTPYLPPLDNAILFLEDVGERPYRIDRMLTTLKQSGWFESVNGIVLGSFTEGDPGTDGVTVEDVFSDHFADAPFPVLSGLPAGHIRENEPLLFGSPCRISGGTLELNY